MRILLSILLILSFCGIPKADGNDRTNNSGRPTSSGGTTKQDQQKKYTYEFFQKNSSF